MAKSTKKAVSVKSAPKKATAKSAPKKAMSSFNSGRTSVKRVAPKSASRPTPKKVAPKSDETMLEELFLDSLKDIYWAEKSLTKSLPKMARAATSADLKNAFEEHLQVTTNQVGRLEQVFNLLGERAQAKKCEAMVGLSKEADEVISETKKGSMTRDVGLIMAAQKVEHYEIATYGSLATLAAQMGRQEIKELLGQTLQEEKDTDMQLTGIAEGYINQEAENEGSES